MRNSNQLILDSHMFKQLLVTCLASLVIGIGGAIITAKLAIAEFTVQLQYMQRDIDRNAVDIKAVDAKVAKYHGG